MSSTPPPIPAASRADLDHLRLLSIFHYVFAGLAVAGLGFLALHFAVMNAMFSNPEAWNAGPKGPSGPPPEFILGVMKWFYAFFALMVVAAGVANLVSGRFITRRRNRLFSLVVAGFNCVQFPFGTALGVFTFVVLLRDSVRELYQHDTRGARGEGGSALG